MSAFSLGQIDILVSTTVIEVGVNVPNATLMVVENAERFGLSQLHQLRGRVGRGAEKSYCVLVSDASSDNAVKRLDVMKNVSCGYEIAKYDLEMRGPGDFIASTSHSAKQHGTSNEGLAALCSDTLLLDKVFKIAGDFVDETNALNEPCFETLLKAVQNAYSTTSLVKN